jgi:hypothetical protein
MTALHRALLLATSAWALACAGSADDATPRTTVLPPAAGGEAFEPTLAMDPANPDRMIAAAMYGVPFGRGGANIWVWRSTDGGRTWADGRLEPPRFPDLTVQPTFAADVIAGFTSDGDAVLGSMSDAPPLGGTFLTRVAGDSLAASSVGVYRNAIDSAAGRRVLHDKPWLVVDHGDESPRRGTVYISVSGITTGLGAAGPGVEWSLLGSNLMVARSQDGGRTVSTPVVVADTSAFGGYLAVDRAGHLHVAYMRIKTRDGAGDAVFYRRSTDGGVTFEPPVTVAEMKADTLLELPALAARPNGDLLACWGQGLRTDERVNQVRCAAKPAGGQWGEPRPLEPALPPGTVPAWPAMVGTERGWYLLLYLADTARTQVALFRSADGASFSPVRTLATAEGLGLDRFCLNPSTPCRRTRSDGFSVGDYVTLTAARGRLAAAYVLPRPGETPGGAAVFVTTLAEPTR